jgi:hypothetical protein
MYQSQLRSTVAVLVLVGHLVVFLVGLLLGVFGPLHGVDVAQTLMMASPVLGATAMSGLTYVLANERRGTKGIKVSHVFAFVVIFLPVVLLASILLIFYFVYIQVPGFGPDNMKISLGAIETIFGGYLGAISTRLFGGS